MRQTQVLVYSPFATSILRTAILQFFIFDSLFSMPFAADKRRPRPRPLHNHIACTSLRPGGEAAETIWRAVNVVSMCRNTFNFFDSLVIFRHYFTGHRKVSCILATISNWFPSKKISKQKLRFLLIVIRQNPSSQLLTSSENLVASAQYLVALVTSESQFQALPAWAR